MQQQSRNAAIGQTAGATAEQTTCGDGKVEEDCTVPEVDKDDVVLVEQTSYIDAERLAARDAVVGSDDVDKGTELGEKRGVKEERLVDVSLSLILFGPLPNQRH